MAPRSFNLTDAIAVLERTPDSLRSILAGLPDVWIYSREDVNSWSPHEVVAHLVHAERTNWVPRVQHILSGETRPFDTFDRTAYFSESKTMNMDAVLKQFSAERQASLVQLKRLNITEGDLERSATHPDLGEVKLRHLLATWTVHDLDHTAQIVRTMARQYSHAVGPWNAYLRSAKK